MNVKLQQPTGDPGKLVYKLDPVPDKDWVNRFNAKIQRTPTPVPLALNVRIENGKLTLDCDIKADLQAVTDQIKKIVEDVNNEDSDWENRLKQIKL